MKKRKLMSIKEIREVPDNLIQKLKIPVYDGEEDEHKTTSMKPKKSKYTLNQIGDALSSFRQEINTRFDRIETRLDYIVKANNLKDLPQNK